MFLFLSSFQINFSEDETFWDASFPKISYNFLKSHCRYFEFIQNLLGLASVRQRWKRHPLLQDLNWYSGGNYGNFLNN